MPARNPPPLCSLNRRWLSPCKPCGSFASQCGSRGRTCGKRAWDFLRPRAPSSRRATLLVHRDGHTTLCETPKLCSLFFSLTANQFRGTPHPGQDWLGQFPKIREIQSPFRLFVETLLLALPKIAGLA